MQSMRHVLKSNKNFTHHVRTGREITLENRLASSPHVGEHRLPKIPTQKRIDWSTRTSNKSLIKVLAGNALSISLKADNLVIVLKLSISL